MIRGEIGEVTNEPVTLYQRMDSADITFIDIKISFDLLKHRSARLFQEVDARLDLLALKWTVKWTIHLIITDSRTPI